MNTTDAYTNLIELLSNHADASNALAILESRTNGAYLDIVETLRPDYTRFQTKIDEATAAIRQLVDAHPEWLTEKKSIKTPFGEIQTRSVTSIEAANEELSIARITASRDRADRAGNGEAVTHLNSLLRVKVELNIEACETLTDEELTKFGLARKTSESFTVKPPAIKLGNAMKAAAKRKPSEKEPAQAAA